VKRAYQPERPLGVAFRDLVRSLLARFDLLYLDPLDPAIRAIGAPFVRQALEAADVYPALIERGKALEKAGYHAQVHMDQQTSLFFVLDGGHRVALKRQGDRYLSGGASIQLVNWRPWLSEFLRMALLRPVLQDYLLPTVAYVGGPAELAYFAQSEVLYSRLLRRMPMMLPRNGFTLVDPRSGKLMERYRLQLPSLFGGENALKESIEGQLLPSRVTTAFAETKAQTSVLLDRLGVELPDSMPALPRLFRRVERRVEYQLSKMERKHRAGVAEADVRPGKMRRIYIAPAYPA